MNRQPNLSEALKNCLSLLRENAFLLVLEPTKNFSLALTLLGQLDANVSDERTCGRFCNEVTWVKEFEKAGLQVVSQVHDGLVHTAFLLRRKTTEAPKGEVKWLDVSIDTYDWVEDLKSYVVDDKVSRIWLKAENPSSGVVGLTACLRRESDGNKIRWFG